MKSIPTGLLASSLAGGASTLVGKAATFGEDAAFLRRHTPLIVLSDQSGRSRIAVAPAWQGRVMTSTAEGDSGVSFGWINRELIASGKLQPHINVFGGEDRFWLGPEGGQFSIFFARGAKFELSDWYTPPPLDTLPFATVQPSESSAHFRAAFAITNYSGTRFEVQVDREVVVLTPEGVTERLGMKQPEGLGLVAYESSNTLRNAGTAAWKKETGLLSVWILGMFNPSPATTIVVPIHSGPESRLGLKVRSDYFGPVPADRLVVKDDVVFFSGDGHYRSKIGINPRRSKGVLGSYDAAHQVLTVVQFTQTAGVTDYVNSMWQIQDHPYAGDVANSYNDGAPSPGAKALGPFYELESSSPAAALEPGKSLTHVHRTFHFTGPEPSLDQVARRVLGVPLADIQAAFSRR